MSLLRTLYESESCVNENIDLNYAINTYRALMEGMECCTTSFKFDARMVPIIQSVEGAQFTYLISLDDVARLAKCNECTLSEALEQIIDCNDNDCDDDHQSITKDNIKVVVLDSDDADELEEACKKDPTKMKKKIKKVEEFTNMIDSLLDAGYKVVRNN